MEIFEPFLTNQLQFPIDLVNSIILGSFLKVEICLDTFGEPCPYIGSPQGRSK